MPWLWLGLPLALASCGFGVLEGLEGEVLWAIGCRGVIWHEMGGYRGMWGDVGRYGVTQGAPCLCGDITVTQGVLG